LNLNIFTKTSYLIISFAIIYSPFSECAQKPKKPLELTSAVYLARAKKALKYEDIDKAASALEQIDIDKDPKLLAPYYFTACILFKECREYDKALASLNLAKNYGYKSKDLPILYSELEELKKNEAYGKPHKKSLPRKQIRTRQILYTFSDTDDFPEE
jgi:hypothetical protein